MFSINTYILILSIILTSLSLFLLIFYFRCNNNVDRTFLPSYLVKNLVLLSILTTILIIIKYAFGNIIGIEFVTFLFCLYALFLSLKDSLFIVVLFNLMILILYGFGSWYLVYWIIYPLTVLVVYLLKKWLKNSYRFAFISGILSFSSIFWYFLSDIIFFDTIYAITNLITALPISIISLISNLLAGLILLKPLSKLFNNNLWLIKPDYQSINIIDNYSILNTVFISTISIIMIIGGSFIIINNSFFINWSNDISNILRDNGSKQRKYHYQYQLGLLKSDNYFNFYNDLDGDEIGIVAIANNNIYKAKIKNNNLSLANIIFDKNKLKNPDQFYFDYIVQKSQTILGRFVGDLWIVNNDQLKQINLDHNYPTVFVGDIRNEQGVEQTIVKNKHIYQFSYDYKIFNTEMFLEQGDFYVK